MLPSCRNLRFHSGGVPSQKIAEQAQHVQADTWQVTGTVRGCAAAQSEEGSTIAIAPFSMGSFASVSVPELQHDEDPERHATLP